jgi:hypothetical protein
MSNVHDFEKAKLKATEAAKKRLERREEKQVESTPVRLNGGSPKLARCPDILAEFRKRLKQLGVAGEEHVTQILYLALTSRVLPWQTANRPISMLVKGTSSTGKSFTVKVVLRFFPETAVETLTSASTLFILYDEDDSEPDPEEYAHRFIYIPEWTTIAEKEELVAILRVLVSEGRISHGTIEGQGKKRRRRLEKEGPTALLMTTTAATTDPELETRCLSVRTDDSPEQTKAIFRVIAQKELGRVPEVNLAPWHDLQRWIETQDTRVLIPYTDRLAELMPCRSVRLRRDFTTILCLVRAHAVLHQLTRERDKESGAIIATLTDYEAVRRLVDALVAEESDAVIPTSIRETIEAVRGILEESDEEFATVRAVHERLGIGHSAGYDRIRRALAKGYLVNVSAGRGYKLKLGDAVPGDAAFLPSVDALNDKETPTPTGKHEIPENAVETRVVEPEILSGVPSEAKPENSAGEQLDLGTASMDELRKY